MKLLTNLPANLRALFSFLRITTIAMGFFWLLAALLHGPFLRHFIPESHLPMAIGEVALKPALQSIQLQPANGGPDALTLPALRGTLLADLGGRDATLQVKLLQTIYPAMAVIIITSYLLFTTLRKVCANLELGQVFTEENEQLVRRVGLVLVASSLVNAALNLWAAFTMGTYLREHAVLQHGLQIAGAMAFELPTGPLSVQTGLITGCLVLMLTAAFRQGLKLQAENDLTV